MKFIALAIYIILQLGFFPFTIIGIILISYKQLAVSRRLGVSATALSATGYRCIMDIFGMRKDPQSRAMYRALPNGSTTGLWLILFPLYIRYKIGGAYKGFPFTADEGKEGVLDVPVTRTIQMDKLINRSEAEAWQFVVMGAGYDTRCYGLLKHRNLKCFEIDKPATQQLKMACLKKAGLDAANVHFAEVDFSAEKWYDKLASVGYDPIIPAIFLWEGVSVYLSEQDVRKTLGEIKAHAATGSRILMDLYSDRVLTFKGTKTTQEHFLFGLNFSKDAVTTLKTFIEGNDLTLGDYYFMGQKTRKGCLGVVVEVYVR
jgi:hypothetical protein